MRKRFLGYLAMCADRRFWQKTVAKFEELTGLSSENEDFWIEAKAGGTPGISDSTTADYAYEHGAHFMGWQAHGDSCGGFPGVSDEEMQKNLTRRLRSGENVTQRQSTLEFLLQRRELRERLYKAT